MMEMTSILRRHMVGLQDNRRSGFFGSPPPERYRFKGSIHKSTTNSDSDFRTRCFSVPSMFQFYLCPHRVASEGYTKHTAVGTGPITAIPHLQRLSEMLT